MARNQVRIPLTLESRFVGGLPLVNAFLDRLSIDRLLERALPSGGQVSHARALGVLLRNIILTDRQPLSTHAEWATRAELALVGLEPDQAAFLNDDRVGRALDRLFDADRAALLTELVLYTVREFDVDLDRLHNDSTTLTLTGEYRTADGRMVRGKPTLVVTYASVDTSNPAIGGQAKTGQRDGRSTPSTGNPERSASPAVWARKASRWAWMVR